LAKTSAGVLNPKHFIGVALILFTTVSVFSVLSAPTVSLGKISSQYSVAVFYAPFFPTVIGFAET
jgi:hypothetical protein